MRGLWFLLLLGVLLMAELAWARIFAGGGVRPPFLVFALIVANWHTSLGKRFLLAFGAGLALDAFSPFPFGIYIFSLMAVASVTELWRTFFSHTESLLSQGMGAALSLIIFYLSTLGAGLIFSSHRGDSFWEMEVAAARIFWHAAIWILLFPTFYFFLRYVTKKVSRTRI